MTAILFVIGCVGFAIVIAWAYGAAGLEAGSSGVGLLAMVESTPPDAKGTARPPRWVQDTARKPGPRTPPGKPDGARPATRGWPRRRGGV